MSQCWSRRGTSRDLHDGKPPCPYHAWPRRSRSHGRRRAATRAGGAAVCPRTCTYLNLMWLAVVCVEKNASSVPSAFGQDSALREVKLVYNLFSKITSI